MGREHSNTIPLKESLPEVETRTDWKLTELDRTSLAYPSQWEGEDEYGRSVYIRYRNGLFCVGLSDHGLDAAVTDSMLSPLITHDLGEDYGGELHDYDMLHLISQFFNVESWLLVLGA